MFLPPSVPALWLWRGTVDPEIQVPSAMNLDLSKVRAGQNIALCASLTVRIFFFFNFWLPIHSSQFFSKLSSSTLKVTWGGQSLRLSFVVGCTEFSPAMTRSTVWV